MFRKLLVLSPSLFLLAFGSPVLAGPPSGSMSPFTPTIPITQRAPTNTDDTSRGYVTAAPNNNWFNAATATDYQAQDVTAGAAIWQPVTAPTPYLVDAIGAGAPSAAYCAVKCYSTFNGNDFQVIRASDGTTKDIGFVSRYVPGLEVVQVADWQTADNFCANTTCLYTKWYDESGAANDATVTPFVGNISISGTALTVNSTTSGVLATGQSVWCGSCAAYTVLTGGSGSAWTVNVSQTVASQTAVSGNNPPVSNYQINGIRALSIDNNQLFSGTSNWYLNLPAGVSASRTATSMVMVGQVLAGNTILVELGNSTTHWDWGAQQNAAPNTAYWNVTSGQFHTVPTHVRSDPAFHAITYGPNQFTSYSDDESSTLSFTEGAATSTGGQLGFSSWAGTGWNARYKALALLIYGSTTLSANQIANAKTVAYPLVGAAPQFDVHLAWITDSIGCGVGSSDGYTRAGMDLPLLSRPVLSVNYCGSGSTAQTWAGLTGSNYVYSRARKNLAVVALGTNDIAAGTSAATTYGYLQTIWTNLSNAGVQCIATTILPRVSGWSGGTGNANWPALNASIRANYAPCVALIDYAANPTIGVAAAANNTSLYFDSIHPTTKTSQIMTAIEVPVINQLLGRPQ